MFGTTTKLSMPSFSSFERLGFRSEINIKKVQDIKNIKNVGMACQKVCKQGRDDIIVKVNLQSPIPTSFYITVAN